MPDKPKDIYDLYKQSRAYNALGFFADPTSQQQMASGLTNALSRGAVGVVGAPVDMLTMGARAFGYGVPGDKVVGSSDWIGRKLENAGMLSKNRNALAELLTGFVSPDPMDAIKLSAMVVPAVAKASKADDMVDLYHGSYRPIQAIKDSGVFGGLFASGRKEAASSHGKFLHKISLNNDEILSHSDLNYNLDYEHVKNALVKHLKVKNPTDDQLETAWKAVIEDKASDGSIDEEELAQVLWGEGASELGWEAQRVRGQVAKALGFKAVEMSDEHGTSYLVLPGAQINPD